MRCYLAGICAERDCLRYGSWRPGTLLAPPYQGWLRGGVYLALAHSAGLAAVAKNGVILTVCTRAFQLYNALNVTWHVSFSQAASQGDDIVIHEPAWLGRYLTLMVPGVAMTTFAGSVLIQFACQGCYEGVAWNLPFFAVVYMLNGMETPLASALKAAGRRRDSYLPQLAGATINRVCALAVVPALGVPGAVLPAAAGSVAGLAPAFVAAWLLFRQRRLRSVIVES